MAGKGDSGVAILNQCASGASDPSMCSMGNYMEIMGSTYEVQTIIDGVVGLGGLALQLLCIWMAYTYVRDVIKSA